MQGLLKKALRITNCKTHYVAAEVVNYMSNFDAMMSSLKTPIWLSINP
jgi:hypothetical protein